MAFVKKPVMLEWTLHAQAKMRHYGLSPSRVRRVLHSPKRIEEGVAPDTIAAMQPSSMKTKDAWTQEIWVMVQDSPKARKVISAWRYPGVTKPRSAVSLAAMRREYDEFVEDAEKEQ